MKTTKKDVPEWYVPLALKKAITNNQKQYIHMADDKVKKFSVILDKLRKIDCLQLSECHYIEFLKLGLYLEQHQQISDLKEFSLFYTRIYRVPHETIRNKFRINIIMNEDNPILNVSDSLKVYEYLGEKKYFLKVASIHRNHVIAIANRTFCNAYSPLKRYNVDLVFNDYTFRCAHDILSLVNIKSIRPYIFPRNNSQNSANAEVNNNERSWFNNEISENLEQKQAVLNICAKSSFPAPYILYGPPGTGKTATIVEAVCQIWKDSDEHILICAPSNAACDVVTRRILEYIKKSNEVYRIYGQGKDFSTIPTEIKNCCNYDHEGFALKLDDNDLIFKRIIIVTLSSSAKLMGLSMKFSHIFIDEAGQATQPDALISVQLMKVTKSSKCQIVISGDPQQLGPCIRSKLAEPILGESILEKLMRHEPYEKTKRNGYDPNYITKLIRNYRSSLDLIQVSNELFYDNELIACSAKKFKKRFPIIFHAVKGKEIKVGSSTSPYNQLEINRVLRYVDAFINTKIEGKQFTAKDIGIVTPFSLQSLKLRKELEKKELSGVDVGTVEIFQGQEKEIIIISTVRSEKFCHDKGEHIGFLSNPRRFNVALTRPKTFLVVVGNPNALQVDRYWKHFLNFCKEKKACRGHDFSLNEDVDQHLQRLNLGSKSMRSDHLFDRKIQLFEKDQDKKRRNT